jgi:hypothetical protein
VEGATSISTILLVDVEVGSPPPHIYICINPPRKKDTTTIELSLEVPSLKNPKIVN